MANRIGGVKTRQPGAAHETTYFNRSIKVKLLLYKTKLSLSLCCPKNDTFYIPFLPLIAYFNKISSGGHLMWATQRSANSGSRVSSGSRVE